MGIALLVLVLIAGLVIIPFGLPGLWVMVGAVLLYSYAGAPGQIGTATIVIVALLAAVGEALELVLAGRYARKYGGSRRAGWGAILGGMAGALVGVPIPIVGSVVGAFAGAFAGALIAERTRGTDMGAATRVATGALIGRTAAVAAKIGVGIAIMVVALFAILLPAGR